MSKILTMLMLAAGMVVLPQTPAAADAGCMTVTGVWYEERRIVQDSSGKTKEFKIRCEGTYGVYSPAIVYVRVEWDHDVYVQVCDLVGDGAAPRLVIRWNDGTVYTYADYQGTTNGKSCDTHRLGISDTPRIWRYVTGDDRKLREWYVTWDGRKFPDRVWPLHSV